MGKVKQLLYSAEIDPTSDLYSDTRSIECSESMHIHERNMRLEYSLEEFHQFLNDFRQAEQARGEIGRAHV